MLLRNFIQQGQTLRLELPHPYHLHFILLDDHVYMTIVIFAYYLLKAKNFYTDRSNCHRERSESMRAQGK